MKELTGLPPRLTLRSMSRMPTVFGPAPGPRNVPDELTHLRDSKDTVTLGVLARTDPKALAKLLPPRCRLDGEARLDVCVMFLTNVGWLAGRGYNIVFVRIPAVYEGEQEIVQGSFCPVMWENMTDPIITGREELGFPKIYARIPNARMLDGSWHGGASWEGYPFFNIEAGTFHATHIPLPDRSPTFFHKYIPKTGEWGESEVSYMTTTGAEGSPMIHSIEAGTGSFGFRFARWEDMPTQYLIVNALAALPLEYEAAYLVKSSGGGDMSTQRILR